jgi:hypothetical protein
LVRAEIALCLGEWEEARALIDQMLAITQSDDVMLVMLVMRVIVKHQCGDIDAAEPFLDRLASVAASKIHFNIAALLWLTSLAFVNLWRSLMRPFHDLSRRLRTRLSESALDPFWH